MPSQFNIDDFERLSKVGEGTAMIAPLFSTNQRHFSLLHFKGPTALFIKSVIGQHHKSMLWRKSAWKAKTMASRPLPSAKYPFSKNSDTKISSSEWTTLRRAVCNSVLRRLRDVILTDARLYLIFEYLAMDLKKYLDCLGENEEMDAILIRVRTAMCAENDTPLNHLELHLSNHRCFTLLSLSPNHSSRFEVTRDGGAHPSSTLFSFEATKSPGGHERHH